MKIRAMQEKYKKIGAIRRATKAVVNDMPRDIMLARFEGLHERGVTEGIS